MLLIVRKQHTEPPNELLLSAKYGHTICICIGIGIYISISVRIYICVCHPNVGVGRIFLAPEQAHVLHTLNGKWQDSVRRSSRDGGTHCHLGHLSRPGPITRSLHRALVCASGQPPLGQLTRRLPHIRP